MTKGGGLMLPYKMSKDIFYNYIKDAENISTISKGAYGITFLLELPDDINTSNDNLFYKKMVPDEEYGEPVKQIIIKFQYILKNDNDANTKDNNIPIQPVKSIDIQNEVNIQTDIFFKTFKYLQPLCPSIVYAEIIDDINQKTEFARLFKNKTTENRVKFLFNQDIIDDYNLGIIAMEMVHNSTTLLIASVTSNSKLFIFFALFSIIIDCSLI